MYRYIAQQSMTACFNVLNPTSNFTYHQIFNI